MTYSWYVGVDLAQAFDYTAICCIEEAVWVSEPPFIDSQAQWPDTLRGWVAPSVLAGRADFFARRTRAGECPGKPPLYLRGLERMRHAPYGVVVERIAAVVRSLPCPPRRVALVIDRTGVGRAIHDRLFEVGLYPVGVTLTGGDVVHPAPGGLSTPKRELVAACQAVLQEGRLRIAAGLELAPTLARELQEFRVSISAAGHDSYNARPGEHDDLLVATALAVWYRDFWNRDYDIRNGRRRQRAAAAS